MTETEVIAEVNEFELDFAKHLQNRCLAACLKLSYWNV